MRILLSAVAVCLTATVAHGATPAEHFERHVRPLLLDKCVSCHGDKVSRGGLRLDSRDAVLKGGDSGPAVVVGAPDKSLLVTAVVHSGELKMPPKAKDKLDAVQVEHLRVWVRDGAVWPGGGAAVKGGGMDELRKSHWSFRPVVRPAVPSAAAKTARNPIDRYVLSRLEAEKLAPSPEADRRTLIRRVSFDLTGLPPTPEDVGAFVADRRVDAYERLVDRYLASPAYGERWGRHWLDVARYADTKGYVFQEERRYPFAWTYRDYVIDALNADLPYDRFVMEQLAADKLVPADAADKRPLAAMGFLTLGRRFLNNTHDIIDDRIDVVTRGLMGLTVSCARCHDHKFDPVPTRDYYSLYGTFAGSAEPKDLPLLTAADPAKGPSAFEKELAAKQAAVDEILAKERPAALARVRKRAAEYLLAAGGGPQAEFGLRPVMTARVKAALIETGKTPHPVWTPFALFARLPAASFAKDAEAVVAKIKADKALDPAVVAAVTAKTPASLKDVSAAYGELFARAEKTPTEKTLDGVRAALSAKGGPFDAPAADLDKLLDRDQRNRVQAAQKKVDAFRATGKGAEPRAMVLQEGGPFNPFVFVRGNPGNRGVNVPRQFLEILTPGTRKPFATGGGRLDLARAIADPTNPLTPRVIANRLWMHHFGSPLVRTPGDFGLRGEKPTHPELLDWLAAEVTSSGWSLKHLHRVMMTSATYRQASEDRDDAAAKDPENFLLWRANRRRLEFEPLRDALLAVSGRLDRQMHGPAVEITAAPFPPRRSVYAFIERQNLPGVFRTFDLASPDVSTPQRHATTVPQQSLFLMNSPFVQDLAKALAARPDVADVAEPEGKVKRMYRLAYGREAEPEEVAAAMAFVKSAPAKEAALTAWEQLAQAVLLANEAAFVD